MTAPPTLTSEGQTFLAQFVKGLTAPSARTARESALAMWMGAKPTLSCIARVLNGMEADADTSETPRGLNRLSQRLSSATYDESVVEANILEWVASIALSGDGAGITIAVDRTDLAHPRARPDRPGGMEYACMCWDGSEGKKGMGYPVVQLEVSNGEYTAPLMYRMYSYNQPGYADGDEPSVFLGAIADAAPYVGSLAVWVFDRGFDAAIYFDGLDRLKVRWVIRLRDRSRKAITRLGEIEWVRDIADATKTPYPLRLTRPDGRKETIEVGGRAVRLLGPDGSPEARERTLIVVRMARREGRAQMHLLAHTVLSKREMSEAVRHYLRRWDIEETTRWLKDSRGFGLGAEDIRVLTFRGQQRLLQLILVAYLFTLHLRLSAPRLITKLRLLTRVWVMGSTPPDPRYRLLAGIRDALRGTPRWAIERWLDPV